MPDPKEDPDHFRDLLHERIEKLEASLAVANAGDDTVAPDNAIGRLSRMEAIQAQSMNAATRLKQEKRLKRARAALDRLDEGTYGDCATCGDPIPPGRLEIMPETPLCVECAR